MGELWSANNLGAVEKSGWGGWEEEDEEVLLVSGAPTYTQTLVKQPWFPLQSNRCVCLRRFHWIDSDCPFVVRIHVIARADANLTKCEIAKIAFDTHVYMFIDRPYTLDEVLHLMTEGKMLPKANPCQLRHYRHHPHCHLWPMMHGVDPGWMIPCRLIDIRSNQCRPWLPSMVTPTCVTITINRPLFSSQGTSPVCGLWSDVIKSKWVVGEPNLIRLDLLGYM